jgi:hypothetical protein
VINCWRPGRCENNPAGGQRTSQSFNVNIEKPRRVYFIIAQRGTRLISVFFMNLAIARTNAIIAASEYRAVLRGQTDKYGAVTKWSDKKRKLTGPYLGLGGLVVNRSRKISFVVITQATKLATTGRQNRQKPLPQTRLDPQLVLGMKAPNPHFSRK